MPRLLARPQETLRIPEYRSRKEEATTPNQHVSSMEAFQLQKWEGNGLKVSVRSNEKCRDCGITYNEANMFRCITHDRQADKVFINVHGKEIPTPDNRARYYKDQDGILLQKYSCFHLKQQICDEIKRGVFNYKKYLPKDRGKLRFKNYTRFYFDRMNRKSELPPDDQNHISKHHLRDTKSAFKNHLQYFDAMDINEIKAPIVQDWLDGLKLGADMKRHLIGYLKGLLSYAHEREDMLVMPKLPSIKRMKNKKEGMTRRQQLEILAHIPKQHHPIFKWAMETGRRINEYRAIKIKDIDEDKNIYRVGGAFDLETYKLYPKVIDHTGEQFPLSVTDNDGKIVYDLRPIILEARNGRIPHQDAFVFEYTNQHGEKSHYSDKTLRRIFNKARKEAGFPNITLNAFARHSLAYQMRLGGATFTDISVALGNTAQVAEANYTYIEAGGKAKVLSMRNLNFGHKVAMSKN